MIGGRRRAGADADRRRQIAVLPDPGPGARRNGGGRLAAHRAHAGPGRGPQAGRRARGLSQFDARRSRGARGRAQARGRRAGPAVCRARAPADAAVPGLAVALAARAVCDRRGSLCLAVGARFPAGVPSALGAARTLSRRAAHRAYGHGRPADARRDPAAARARRCARVRGELRPTEYPLHHRRQGRRAGAPAALHSRGARRRSGHRVLPLAPQGGRDRGVAGRAARRRAALPRGHGRGEQGSATRRDSSAKTASWSSPPSPSAWA